MSDKRIAYNAQRRLAVIDQYISSGTYPTASFLADILEYLRVALASFII